MLPSLGIRNYRNLKSLDIERLARVNLIAGKNNTGKTSLLEAVSLYAAGGDISWMNQILVDRDEILIKDDIQRTVMGRTVQPDSYLSLFHDRQTNLYSDEESISIGGLNGNLLERIIDERAQVSIRMVRFVREQFISENGKTSRTVILEEGDSDEFVDEISVGLEMKVKGEAKLYNLERERVRTNFRGVISHEVSSFQFVKTRHTESDYNGALWDTIALTEYEDYVAEALRIIDPLVDRITFVNEETNRSRKPVVKLKKHKNVLPLQSMGDGMNRILTIILALVNAADGYLLIDEFENGLHHTVQEDLWKMIFKLAKELNVQVFATTHSDDCIHAFESVLNSEGNQSEGQYFRLERFGDIIKPIFYSANELEIAAEQNIETR
jgi:predicted ATPase